MSQKRKVPCHTRIMSLLIIILIVLSNHLHTGEAINDDSLELPDYDVYKSVSKPKLSLRERFLERKIKNKKSEVRIDLLKKYSSDTVYFDGVAHFEVNKKLDTWKMINETEVGLRKLLAAEGADYNYKRDHYWRTWKKVVYPNGVTKIVCYKCNSVVNATCKKCTTAGFWSIEEEAPPCPLELFSVVNEQQICAANFTRFYNYNDECPIILSFADVLSTCDNPIKTTYHIKRLFKISNGLPSTICGRQDYCEISTYYRIYKDFIFFRVTNSSDDIVYSRLMKHGNKNYACIRNCGRIDNNTNNVTDNKPLSFSLLPSHVNKRENEIVYEDNTGSVKELKKKKQHTMPAIPKLDNNTFYRLGLSKRFKKTMKFFVRALKTFNNTYFSKKAEADTTTSSCSRLSKQMTTEDYEDNYKDYHYEDQS